MFQFIPVAEENTFAVKVSGKLTDEDYQQFLPQLTTLIHKYGPISLLVELEDFKGWEPKAAWDDFRFGKEHDKDFIRIAIVGRKSWHRWMVALGDAFTDTKIRFFFRDDLQEAWDWLREGNQKSTDVAETEASEALPQKLQPYTHILVALDFSSHANQALARALEMARHYKAKLSLIHTVENISYPSMDYDPLMVDPAEFMAIDQQVFDNATARMEKLAASLDYPDVQQQVLWGPAKSTILSFAEAQDVDLIVAGSHGRHGIARLLGSTATAIANSASCDVLVVKLRDE